MRQTLPLVIILLLARTAVAHEGPPFPLFVDQKVDRYVISLWSDPDVGDALFFVIISGEPPPDLQVQIGVQPASGRLPEAFYPAMRENVSGQVSPSTDGRVWSGSGRRLVRLPASSYSTTSVSLPVSL